MTDPAQLSHYPAQYPAQYPPAPTQPGPRSRRGGPSLRARWAPADEVRAGLVIVVVLAVAGALLGVLWQWWSPPGPLGYVVAPGAVQPDETEAFIAADGRFAVIAAAVGLVAAVVVWRRKQSRGPVAAAALAVGGLLGALLMAMVGHALAGGQAGGKPDTVLHHLPLTVHIRGLLLLEAAVAVLVYSLFASFAADDDLGRPDPSGPTPFGSD